MARAKELVRHPEPLIQKQLSELVKAVNRVSIGPLAVDLDPDGTPRHGSSSAQLDSVFLSFESKGVGVPVELEHELGRVPCGFLETSRRHPGGIVGVPNDQAVNRAWSATRIHLVPQTPSGTKHSVMIC